jgi:hypothetical protein
MLAAEDTGLGALQRLSKRFVKRTNQPLKNYYF